MVKLNINLEKGDGYFYAHSINLLGCYAKANTKSEVIDAILIDAKKYSGWLISFVENSTQKIFVKELLTSISDLDITEEKRIDNEVFLFESDKEDLTEEEFTFYLSIFEKLPEQLLRIVFQYSRDELEQIVIPEKPTIEQILTNLYKEELATLDIISEEFMQKFFDSINMNKDEIESLTLLERIVKVKQGITSILKHFYQDYKNQIITGKTGEDIQPSIWTFKKIIRVLIEHERENINLIRYLVNVLEENKTAIKNDEYKN